MDMDDSADGGRVTRLAAILERAHQVHGVVTEMTGGDDPDWPLFYAWWLLTWSDFSEVLGRPMSMSALAVELVRLDAAYRAGPGEVPWPAVYADALFNAVSERAD
jgi:hypothetical protein